MEEIIRPRTALRTEAKPVSSNMIATPILIKNGVVVNSDRSFQADVLIQDGVIKNIDYVIQNVPADTIVVDAKGCYVMPGGIDTHVHFELPFMGTQSVDDFLSGTRAALAGGTTMIMDFVISPGESLIEGYTNRRKAADSKVCCDYGLHIGITSYNDATPKEMESLVSEGVNSFKVFMTYANMQIRDREFLQILECCRNIGAIALVHAENGDVIALNQKKLLEANYFGPEAHLYSRPEEVEAEATNRAIVLANQVQCPLYVVHVMSKSAADVIATKRQQGCKVFGESVAAALGSDGTQYFSRDWRHAAAHVMSPPLRPDPSTKDYLLKCLASGALDATGSDHCTFTADQKSMGRKDFTKIPNGVNGVQDRMSIIWERGVMNGLMDICTFVSITSSNAAKIFNIYPRKGRIDIGSDADIVVWDPNCIRKISKETSEEKVDFNIFEGTIVRGSPAYVISRGKIVKAQDKLNVAPGSGKYIPMPPFSPHAFSSLRRKQLFPLPVDRGDLAESFGGIGLSPDGSNASNDEFRTRPPTRSGGRNLQDSSFSLSGAQIDDDKKLRSSVKVNNPPGGQSSGLW